MAKEVSFSVAEPLCEKRAMMLCDFLIVVSAKAENQIPYGTVKKIEKAS